MRLCLRSHSCMVLHMWECVRVGVRAWHGVVVVAMGVHIQLHHRWVPNHVACDCAKTDSHCHSLCCDFVSHKRCKLASLQYILWRLRIVRHVRKCVRGWTSVFVLCARDSETPFFQQQKSSVQPSSHTFLFYHLHHLFSRAALSVAVGTPKYQRFWFLPK